MSEWHPSIVRLGTISNLSGSDFLEITTIMGEYPVVIRKGEYQEGQLVSFIPYDSIVPDTEQWHFLAKPIKRDKDGNVDIPPPPVGEVPVKDRTIRAKRIRGMYSEGLITYAPEGFKEGDCIIGYFGLTKREYEEELPEKGSNDNEVSPITFSLFKYDLEGMAKYGYVFEEGEQVIITEKIEGENCAFVYLEDKLWVRSRNHFKRESDDSHWWDLPHRLSLQDKLKPFSGLAFWGELYGGVKHFKYDCPIVDGRIQRKFRVFDIWDTKHHRFLPWNEIISICQQIGLETIPILYEGEWKTDRSLHGLAEGISTIGACVREGFVMRSVPEGWHEKLGRKIIKLKGRDYKIFKG